MPPAAALMAPLEKEEIQTLTSPLKPKQTTEVEVLDHDANTKEAKNSSVVTDEKKIPTTVKKEKAGDGVETDVVPPSSRKKKNKTTAVKCEQDEHIKEEVDESAEKKPKRPRISESIVKDAAQKMLSVLIKNYKDEISEVPLDVLASSITSKSGKPYKNPRSDAIQMGLKLLKKEGKAEKNGGNARLLKSEIDQIPKEEILKDPAKVLEQRLKQFLERLASNPKGGTGDKLVTAAQQVWDKLCDGKAYTRRQLVAVTSYKGTNSSGFEAIMKVLNELKFVDGKGQSSFTEKIFPHGRP